MLLLLLLLQLTHPLSRYLFPGVEDRSLPPLGEHVVDACGKMKLLDKLMTKLKARGHRMLIFTQMTLVLDILEDVMRMRGHKYCRIDGGTEHELREEYVMGAVLLLLLRLLLLR